MLKFLQEIINSSRSGWYSGKGFKAQKKKQFERALHFYKLARRYSDTRFDPVIYESMAFVYCELNQYKEALFAAQKSIKQYNSVENKDHKFSSNIKKVKELIKYLESKN